MLGADDVGPPGQQVGRQSHGYGLQHLVATENGRIGKLDIGSGAQQQEQSIARLRLGPSDTDVVRTDRIQLRARLIQVQRRCDAGVVTGLHQRQGVFPGLQSAAYQCFQLLRRAQAEIALGHLRHQVDMNCAPRLLCCQVLLIRGFR